jgi:hypothetical protein
LEVAAGAPIVGVIVSWGIEKGDAGILGEVRTGKVAGGVGVVDGEDCG